MTAEQTALAVCRSQIRAGNSDAVQLERWVLDGLAEPKPPMDLAAKFRADVAAWRAPIIIPDDGPRHYAPPPDDPAIDLGGMSRRTRYLLLSALAVVIAVLLVLSAVLPR